MKTTDFFVNGFRHVTGGTVILSHAELKMPPLCFNCLSFKHAIRFLRELGLSAAFNPQSFQGLNEIKVAPIRGVNRDQVGDAAVAAGVLPF